MLIDNYNEKQKYNVFVDGKLKKEGVIKSVVDNFVISLDESLQSKVTIVPVTDEGQEILFG